MGRCVLPPVMIRAKNPSLNRANGQNIGCCWITAQHTFGKMCVLNVFCMLQLFLCYLIMFVTTFAVFLFLLKNAFCLFVIFWTKRVDFAIFAWASWNTYTYLSIYSNHHEQKIDFNPYLSICSNHPEQEIVIPIHIYQYMPIILSRRLFFLHPPVNSFTSIFHHDLYPSQWTIQWLQKI